MHILELGRQFRPATSHVYPPFKNGRYMEEYVFDYCMSHPIKTDYIYIPVFWTNLQNHPGFADKKELYNKLLKAAYSKFAGAHFFTVVQHDDGPALELPPGTLIFGACTGTIPLPLIYEDQTERLIKKTRMKKDILASFVGSITHPIREKMMKVIQEYDDIVCQGKAGWSSVVSDDLADTFIHVTLRSKFCLAPRGYGRSSFRFFEAIQLDCIPVYLWDDKCWLPYQDQIDYSTFSICIHEKDIYNIHKILTISDERYEEMMDALYAIKEKFTLEFMCGYIRDTISKNSSS
jgi:hypothetical protein